MASRLEEELKAIREELDALEFYAPREASFTEEELVYYSEMVDNWVSGEPWSPEDVPDHLFPDTTAAGGWKLSWRNDFFPVLKELYEEGYFDADLEEAESG